MLGGDIDARDGCVGDEVDSGLAAGLDENRVQVGAVDYHVGAP